LKAGFNEGFEDGNRCANTAAGVTYPDSEGSGEMGFEGIEGKRVVVTAAASGIGKVIAVRMAEAGARVHICDIDKSELASMRREHPAIGASVADVSSCRDVDQMFDAALARLDGLDVLVNCAGIAGPNAFVEDIDCEGWTQTVEVNLTGAFLCAKRAVPLLKQQRAGCIVNISSDAGLMGMARRSPYVAAKWALIGFTKTLAMELGPFGVRANAICPGYVEGDRLERVIADEAAARGASREDVVADWVATTSMRTLVTPHDIANATLFLCSDMGARISGQAFAVDGHCEHL
jgi:NAD(P)-dependent dehydrogenase (short-subunit alcohol dehydrogenase family)